jgi:imidazoleglycerol-phosphate dehydratase/histidinol-phosphatase
MLEIFKNEGVRFDNVLIDDSYPHQKKDTRKPGTGMLTSYLKGNYDLANSFVIGDRATDVQLAKNLGAKGIYIHTDALADDLQAHCGFQTTSWDEIYEFLRYGTRSATVVRNTSETKITVQVDLSPTAPSQIATGIGFFDHMLEQIARHGLIGLKINVSGDLHIDEHHTVEDTALALGAALKQALGNKIGIERYGFALPMDESAAQVLIDFGGRPEFVWQAEFQREKIGELSTEMFRHFFKSFSDAAACNLHIAATGTNEHHKIEGIFKAFAKAIKMAIRRDPMSNQLPSTKGVL